MPSATLVNESAVLVSGGWLPIKSIAGSEMVHGADRHGKITEALLSVKAYGKECSTTFLGSRGTFGYFTDVSRVVTGTGKCEIVGEIIERMVVNEIRFESVTDFSALHPTETTCAALWSSMATCSAVCIGEAMTLHTNSERSEVKLSVTDRIGPRYLQVKRRPFIAKLLSNWTETLRALADEAFTNSEGVVCIEREQHLLAIWIASALRMLRSRTRVEYDGLQHTSTLMFTETRSAPQPLELGSCAFFSARKIENVRVEWHEPSWNPIVCGFFVAPD